MTIRGTVATSSHTTVQEIILKNINPDSGITEELIEDLVRIDFPKDYSMWLGCQFDTPHIRCYRDHEDLVFSVLEQPLGDHILLSPKLWSPNKPVNTQTLNEYDDLQWFAIPRHFVEGFNINDKITLSIVKETEDRERYIRCQKQR